MNHFIQKILDFKLFNKIKIFFLILFMVAYIFIDYDRINLFVYYSLIIMFLSNNEVYLLFKSAGFEKIHVKLGVRRYIASLFLGLLGFLFIVLSSQVNSAFVQFFSTFREQFFASLIFYLIYLTYCESSAIIVTTNKVFFKNRQFWIEDFLIEKKRFYYYLHFEEKKFLYLGDIKKLENYATGFI